MGRFSNNFQNFRFSSPAHAVRKLAYLLWPQKSGGIGILTSKSLTIWAESGMQDSSLMSRNLDDTGEGRVAPNCQLVIRHAVAGDKLTVAKFIIVSIL